MAQAQDVEAKTETPNVLFNLVSILYHELQQAEVCERYLKDAQTTGDQELIRFFEACQRSATEIAQRAKSLVGARIQEDVHAREDDLVEEGSKESFPASDAPAY